MDLTVVAELESAGIELTSTQRMPTLALQVDAQQRVQPLGDEVVVVSGESTKSVALKKISALFAGTRTPPSFRSGPTDDYLFFFATIEHAVLEFCHHTERLEYDAEIERLYTHLRRRPDGRDANPLFSYMQAAARLYMSAFDVNQAEFDAVVRRLSQSAGRFADGPTSTNYVEVIADGFGPLTS